MNTIIKDGWLTKQGGSSFFTNWKKRYFKLDYAAGSLSYFESPKIDEKPLGVVVVRNATVAPYEKEKEPNKFYFTIASNDRTFRAYADSKSDQEEWVKALTRFDFYSFIIFEYF
jgi:hypothetical protein